MTHPWNHVPNSSRVHHNLSVRSSCGSWNCSRKSVTIHPINARVVNGKSVPIYMTCHLPRFPVGIGYPEVIQYLPGDPVSAYKAILCTVQLHIDNLSGFQEISEHVF